MELVLMSSAAAYRAYRVAGFAHRRTYSEEAEAGER